MNDRKSSMRIHVGICIGAWILGLIATPMLYILSSVVFFLGMPFFLWFFNELFFALIINPIIFCLGGILVGYVLVRGNIDRGPLFLPLLLATPGFSIAALMFLNPSVDYVSLPFIITCSYCGSLIALKLPGFAQKRRMVEGILFEREKFLVKRLLYISGILIVILGTFREYPASIRKRDSDGNLWSIKCLEEKRLFSDYGPPLEARIKAINQLDKVLLSLKIKGKNGEQYTMIRKGKSLINQNFKIVDENGNVVKSDNFTYG